jgi:hypothetical protein
VRREADEAVKACGWDKPYFVDADHISLQNVDQFIEASDFFTIDVADFIGKPALEADVHSFGRRHRRLIGSLRIEGIDDVYEITEERIRTAAGKYLLAIKQSGEIYRHIRAAKGNGNFITEVSMDEANEPQAPVELLFILAALVDESVPVQTIAPKFTGRFNKGVDYVGDVTRFAREFEADLAVVRFTIREFGLPENLKLSIHSGSDKFSIYPPINEALRRFDMGVHIKTAGTTWLEELAGLAMAGGDGLAIAKEIYAQAFARIDELTKPYVTVVDIDRAGLPRPEQVARWDGRMFASVLRHDQSCELYNPHFRQVLHLAYKIAAQMGQRFYIALKDYEDVIMQNVTDNIYNRHIRSILMCM